MLNIYYITTANNSTIISKNAIHCNDLSLFSLLVIRIDGWNIHNHYEFILIEFIELGYYYGEITHYDANRLVTIFDKHITFRKIHMV